MRGLAHDMRLVTKSVSVARAFTTMTTTMTIIVRERDRDRKRERERETERGRITFLRDRQEVGIRDGNEGTFVLGTHTGEG